MYNDGHEGCRLTGGRSTRRPVRALDHSAVRTGSTGDGGEGQSPSARESLLVIFGRSRAVSPTRPRRASTTRWAMLSPVRYNRERLCLSLVARMLRTPLFLWKPRAVHGGKGVSARPLGPLGTAREERSYSFVATTRRCMFPSQFALIVLLPPPVELAA
eukprot:3761859-Pyramimonas_sp.AAC.1